MKKFALASLAIAAAFVFAQAASAQSVYNFTFTGVTSGPYVGDTASGSLTVNGGDLIEGLTGTYDSVDYGSSAMVLDAVGSFGSNDNLFNPTGSPSYFDTSGLSFKAGGNDYNLFYINGTFVESSLNGNGYYTNPQTPVDFSATHVPDGGTTLTLLGLAIAGLAGLRRKLSV
jgi:hypothetical protein